MGSGPALVLVHGLLGYSFSWRRVIPTLAREYEVFAPDLPGAGFSECSPALDTRLAASAERLAGFVDAVNIVSCDLVGSSYGGATSVIFAANNGTRLRRLILVSPANPWSRIGGVRLGLLRNRALAAVFPVGARLMRPLHTFFVRRMYGDYRRATADSLGGYALPLMRPGVFEHAVRLVRTWHNDMQEFQDAIPKLKDIPVLLIWGSRDRVVDMASMDSLGRSLGSAKTKTAVIAGAGHLPYEECPEEFCTIVLDFLSGASGPGDQAMREVT
jgi:pimeloyl-ACP methyl ester carboxylesterase